MSHEVHCKTRQSSTHTFHLGQAELLHTVENNIVRLNLTGGQIKLRQAKTLAHLITDVGREEQSEAFDAQVAVTILSASHCMYLRVSVQVANPLDVHDNQLVVGALECEVAKGLWGVAYMNILHEATVRVVLDVLAIDEVLQVVQRLVWSILELKD